MAKRTTIENAELTITLNDQSYVFPWVQSVAIADPRENTLSASPQGTGIGLAYQANTNQPVTGDMIVRDISTELFGLLIAAFENQERCDFMLFDKLAGDQHVLNNSVIRTNPSNVTVAEGEEALNIALNVSCAQNQYTHTPPPEDA